MFVKHFKSDSIGVKMSEEMSIVIIGGGPAGGAAALEFARASCKVVLIERQPLSCWKIGETLPPEASIHLQRLGVWEQFQSAGHLPCHGVVSVWGQSTPVEKDHIFNPHGHGWQLDRVRFESGLLNAAVAEGCDVQFGVTVDQIERHAAPGRDSLLQTEWLVRTSTGTLRADLLVDCTGRQGGVISHEGGQYEQIDQLVSVFCIGVSPQLTDFDSRTYVESHPDGWCYSALMPNGRRTIAFQTDADLVPTGSPTIEWLWKVLGECPTIARLLRKHAYHLMHPPSIVAAHSGRFQNCCGRDWIAVGDAAMTVDPLSGQGSGKAIYSAHRAIQAILHEGDYQSEYEEAWRKYLNDRRDYYRAEERWIDRPFWSRRQEMPRERLLYE